MSIFLPLFLPLFLTSLSRLNDTFLDTTTPRRYFYIDFLKVHYSARKTTPSLRGEKKIYIYIKNEKKLKIHMQSQYYWCIRQIGDRDSIKYYIVWNTGSCMDDVWVIVEIIDKRAYGSYETSSMEWNDRRINIDTYSKIEDTLFDQETCIENREFSIENSREIVSRWSIKSIELKLDWRA